MRGRIALMGLLVVLFLNACAPSPVVIEIEKEVPVEKEVIQTVVVEKEVPVEIPVTVEVPVEVTREVVVTPTATPTIFPAITLGEVKLEKDELIFSWFWPYDGNFEELKDTKFCVWIWKMGERLPTETWCSREYFDTWENPYADFTTGVYSWQVELRWGGIALTTSPVGEFILPTPTPTASP